MNRCRPDAKLHWDGGKPALTNGHPSMSFGVSCNYFAEGSCGGTSVRACLFEAATDTRTLRSAIPRRSPRPSTKQKDLPALGMSGCSTAEQSRSLRDREVYVRTKDISVHRSLDRGGFRMATVSARSAAGSGLCWSSGSEINRAG